MFAYLYIDLKTTPWLPNTSGRGAKEVSIIHSSLFTFSLWISRLCSSSFKLSSNFRYCFLYFISRMLTDLTIWSKSWAPNNSAIGGKSWKNLSQLNFRKNIPVVHGVFFACLWGTLRVRHMRHLKTPLTARSSATIRGP